MAKENWGNYFFFGSGFFRYFTGSLVNFLSMAYSEFDTLFFVRELVGLTMEPNLLSDTRQIFSGYSLSFGSAAWSVLPVKSALAKPRMMSVCFIFCCLLKLPLKIEPGSNP